MLDEAFPQIGEGRKRMGGEGWRLACLTGLALALVGAFLLSLALGSVRIPLTEVIAVLSGGEATKPSWSYIILAFRLPKALTAILAGAALAVSGLQMQTLFRNPLADPSILGINAGASLGVALVVLATGAATGFLSNVGLLGDLSLIASAIAGASLVTGLVIVAARWLRHAMTLLILGLMLSYATSAVVSILIYFSVPEQIQAYIAWTFGSFGGVTGRQLTILAPVIGAGLLLAGLLAKPLNALLLGEAYARSMGVHVQRVRFWLITGTSVLAGTVTAFCGPIAFLGVAIPHLCRALLCTSDHRLLVPATLLMGGLVALLADLIASVPGSRVLLPLNAVTALLGAPIVVWIVLRRDGPRSDFAS
ncbi:MAG: iron ABC transporter permease [Candidatus Competibacteraceae bacterium]|nr:MAG: iron ABC transporter permease [Candidatus Competibacteraceae bacterium]